MSVQRTPRVHHGVRPQSLANRASVRVYGLSCAHVHVNANTPNQNHYACNVHVHEQIPVHPYTSRNHAGLQAYTMVYARCTPYASRALPISPILLKEKKECRKQSSSAAIAFMGTCNSLNGCAGTKIQEASSPETSCRAKSAGQQPGLVGSRQRYSVASRRIDFVTSKKPMREAMPITTRFIDSFREAFGVDQINPSIKDGIQGHAGAFYASEAGQTIGTPTPDLSAISVKLSETLVGRMAAPKKERN